jgi:hypothetical protein
MVVYITGSNGAPACGGWDDATKEQFWTNRERGILEAYKHMAASSASWIGYRDPASYPMYVRYDLPAGAQYPNQTISVVFFRLEDGGLIDLWDGAPKHRLYCVQHCPQPSTWLPVVTDNNPIDRTKVISALHGLMTSYGAHSVSTLDATALHTAILTDPDPFVDNGTHVAAAMFGIAALAKYQAASTTTKHLRLYRGYSAEQEYENLSNVQRDDKRDAFQTYANWDCTQNTIDTNGACMPGYSTTLCGGMGVCGQLVCLDGICRRTSCPVFDNHWKRTYSTRSILGSGELQGRLATNTVSAQPACLSITGATTLPRIAAVASSTASGSKVSRAIDGNLGTKWTSNLGDPQWIYVDVGSSRYITRVDLSWDVGYARSFEIQVSDDLVTWTTKYSTTTGSGGTQQIALPANTKGRYVRMYGTARGNTSLGYSVWEFGVHTYTGVSTLFDCPTAPSWVITSVHQIKLSGTNDCLHSLPNGSVTLSACNVDREGSTFFMLSNGQIIGNPNYQSLSPPLSTFSGLVRTPSQCVAASPVAGGAITERYCRKTCIDEDTGQQRSCESQYPACASGCAAGTTCFATPHGDKCLKDCNPGLCDDPREVCEPRFDGSSCVPRPGGTPDAFENWTILFDTPTLRSTQFSDASGVGSTPAYYRTFGIATGNVCNRVWNGVWCWQNATNQMVQITPGFDDNGGWLAPENGSTVAAVVDRPTTAPTTIACGRGYYGAGCTTGSTASFNTGAGWASAPYYYNSIRYVDVTGDDRPDICGRGYYGIECALNLGTSFTNAVAWTSEFSAATYWNAEGLGDTIQYGDIDGDRKTDVCGRGDYGIDCALGTGSSFMNYHPWSFDNDRRMGNASTFGIQRDFRNYDTSAFGTIPWRDSVAYYGSIKLVDINRDGFADVCGRGGSGIYCAFSVGNGFEPKRLVLGEDFLDPGWQTPDKGSTITFGDLDGDQRVDVCGRSYWGIVCGEGY